MRVRLTISEGRYHQVKRMFAAVLGNRVVGTAPRTDLTPLRWMRIWLGEVPR